MEPNETETRVRVETEITDEEHPIIDELKSLITRNETDEYLPFKKLDHRKLRDVTKKVNAVIGYIEKDAVTQTNLLWRGKEELKMILPTISDQPKTGVQRSERRKTKVTELSRILKIKSNFEKKSGKYEKKITNTLSGCKAVENILRM